MWFPLTRPINVSESERVYGYVFDFERKLDPIKTKQWFESIWHISLYIIATYLVLIYAGQRYMKSRPAFQLRRALFYWNLVLAVFSTWGAFRTWSYMLYLLFDVGFHETICTYIYDDKAVVFSFWIMLFTLSKVLELGDTLFIVLRKSPLIFLHWYHHITVLLYVWYTVGLPDIATSARWFMTVNYGVHSLMYSYFALKALKVRVPRIVSMVITAVQISQMVLGVYVAVWTYWMKAKGQHCHMPDYYPKVSLTLYFSYFFLFLHFFIDAYIHKTSIMKRVLLKKEE